ncbi:MAG: hypothetical protein ING82_01835, partial [Roseomonas sp.]|nr:hypothetical protein [Roseomonas sp.]
DHEAPQPFWGHDPQGGDSQRAITIKKALRHSSPRSHGASHGNAVLIAPGQVSKFKAQDEGLLVNGDKDVAAFVQFFVITPASDMDTTVSEFSA